MRASFQKQIALQRRIEVLTDDYLAVRRQWERGTSLSSDLAEAALVLAEAVAEEYLGDHRVSKPKNGEVK